MADPIEMTPGEPTVVRVSVTNDTTDRATLAGWLDLNGIGTSSWRSGSLSRSLPVRAPMLQRRVPAGPGPRRVRRFRLFPGDVTDPRPLGEATLGEVEDYPVTVLTRELVITKTSDATADSRPGDIITYTVTADNTGTGDFTAANPARVVDDLSGLLDDANFNGDAAADFGDDPAYTAPPALDRRPAAGETVTITYTVTLKGGGDGDVDNVAWAPPWRPPGRRRTATTRRPRCRAPSSSSTCPSSPS